MLIIRFLIPIAVLLTLMRPETAEEIVQKAYDKMYGESSYSEMEMKIIHTDWERTIKFKSWTLGTEYSLTLVTYPAREEGKTFLKRNDQMWRWSPVINRMIKLPPSMMSQGWMGSNYTNDDIMNESSIVEDYIPEILGEETINGHDCHKIRLQPKEDAPVVWGGIITWITKQGFNQLRAEYYDEEGKLIKTHNLSDMKILDGRNIPTTFEIVPENEEGQRTVVKILDINFDTGYNEPFFSFQNMKQVR